MRFPTPVWVYKGYIRNTANMKIFENKAVFIRIPEVNKQFFDFLEVKPTAIVGRG